VKGPGDLLREGERVGKDERGGRVKQKEKEIKRVTYLLFCKRKKVQHQRREGRRVSRGTFRRTQSSTSKKRRRGGDLKFRGLEKEEDNIKRRTRGLLVGKNKRVARTTRSELMKRKRQWVGTGWGD